MGCTMHDELFPLLEPPTGALPRLRATLRRRAQRRRWRRAALGVVVVLVAGLVTMRAIRDHGGERPPEIRPGGPWTQIAAFDAALHPALVVGSDLPPLSPRGDSLLLRRPTLDDDVVLYELGP